MLYSHVIAPAKVGLYFLLMKDSCLNIKSASVLWISITGKWFWDVVSF
jgi:hypothetical protein